VEVFKAILLGIIQGLTEFFPISSSAHLYIFKHLLAISNDLHLLELSCHIGTLGCIFLSFKTEIKEIFCSFEKFKNMFFAVLPLVFLYFLIKPFIVNLSSIKYLGYFFCFTALLLFLSSSKKIKLKKENLSDYIFIGFMQTIALLPGVSRSGATISAARLRGWDLKKAAVFSFLLSIPTVMGGFLLEMWKSKSEYVIFKNIYIIAGISSFLTGLLTIRLFFIILKKDKFSIFAWYCLILGIILILTYG
jgi:undecaprenyl-diphosphatase